MDTATGVVQHSVCAGLLLVVVFSLSSPHFLFFFFFFSCAVLWELSVFLLCSCSPQFIIISDNPEERKISARGKYIEKKMSLLRYRLCSHADVLDF